MDSEKLYKKLILGFSTFVERETYIGDTEYDRLANSAHCMSEQHHTERVEHLHNRYQNLLKKKNDEIANLIQENKEIEFLRCQNEKMNKILAICNQ